MAIEVPICAITAPRTVPTSNSRRSSIGDAVRRSWRTKATAAAAAPRTEATVITESQPCCTPLVSA